MKRLLSVRRAGTMLMASALVAACGTDGAPSGDGGSAPEPRVLTYASYLPESSALSQSIIQWGDQVEELTDGGLSFEYNFDASLLGASDLLAGVGDGRADMGLIAPAVSPAELALSHVGYLPFATPDIEAHMRAVATLLDEAPELQGEYQAVNNQALFPTPSAANVILSNEPIEGIEDFAGRQIRGFGYVINGIDLAGGNAVAIAAVEQYEAMDRGVIDAISGQSLDLAVDFGLHEVSNFMTDPGYGIYSYAMQTMNKELYDGLPGSWREAIDTATADYTEQFISLQVAQEDEACQIYIEDDGQVSVWNADETAAWEEVAREPIVDVWIEQAEAAGHERSVTDALAERFFELVEEYEEESSYEPAAARCAANGGEG